MLPARCPRVRPDPLPCPKSSTAPLARLLDSREDSCDPPWESQGPLGMRAPRPRDTLTWEPSLEPTPPGPGVEVERSLGGVIPSLYSPFVAPTAPPLEGTLHPLNERFCSQSGRPSPDVSGGREGREGTNGGHRHLIWAGQSRVLLGPLVPPALPSFAELAEECAERGEEWALGVLRRLPTRGKVPGVLKRWGGGGQQLQGESV